MPVRTIPPVRSVRSRPAARLGRPGVLLVLAILLGLIGPPVGTGVGAGIWQVTTVDGPTYGGQWTSLAVDTSNLPHISYHAQDGQYRFGLKYASYDGAAWHVEMVDDTPGTGWYTSLAIDSSDRPHIAYHHAHDALMYARRESSGWHIEVVDSGGDVGEHASLRLDSGGQPAIAYTDETARAVKYAHLTGLGWQIETVATLITTGRMTWLSLALDSANRPHISYYDYDTRARKYAYNGGGGWQIAVVDAEDGAGEYNAIAVDGQGRAHISYRGGGTLYGLKYAHYDGSKWIKIRVDPDFLAGDGTSIDLDQDGCARIAYGDLKSPNRQLRYAWPDGAGWQIDIVAVAPSSGIRYDDMSIALDQDDRPHLSFHVVGTDDLKYALKDIPILNIKAYLPLTAR